MIALSGKLLCKRSELDLFCTLLGGQTFRWKKVQENGKDLYIGVSKGLLWELWQCDTHLYYKAFSKNAEIGNSTCENILRQYFRLDTNLVELYAKWNSAHKHFRNTAKTYRAIRVLDQDPFENVISFICSQNNNIKRISTMVEWLCTNYAPKICDLRDVEHFSFPSLEDLDKPTLEIELKEAKFGYRATFIANAVNHIKNSGGENWLRLLGDVPYSKAREELLTIPGVGPKVADCVCLMSLNHLGAVPVDTHIFKVAKQFYMPTLLRNHLSRKTYDEISNTLREIYGEHAGWAQTVLFCSDLRILIRKKQFENNGC